MRHVLTGAALLLVVGATAACGGGAPEDASKGDFCEAFGGIRTIKDGKDLNELGYELEDVGTPEDISDDEREGFEIFVDAAQDVDEDAKPDDFDEATDFSKDEEKKGDKFFEYAAKTCPDAVPGGSDSPDAEVPDATDPASP